MPTSRNKLLIDAKRYGVKIPRELFQTRLQDPDVTGERAIAQLIIDIHKAKVTYWAKINTVLAFVMLVVSILALCVDVMTS
jgi:hypothetical protein